MFFDNLAGIVERHLPEFVPMMAQANLFRLESHDADVTPSRVLERWEPDQRTIENFRLPFSTACLETIPDRNSSSDRCLILQTLDENQRRYRFLTGQRRDDEDGNEATLVSEGELVALPDAEQSLDGDYGRIANITRLAAWCGNKKAGVRQRAFGAWTVTASATLGRTAATVMAEGRATIDGRTYTLDEVKGDLALLERMRMIWRRHLNEVEADVVFMECCLGVLSVLTINEPASFIVEERPLAEVRTPPTRIPRSVGRPHYIVLKPRQIRQRFLYPIGQPEPDGDDKENDEKRKVAPHERRGHFRRLQSDRFKNARGQVIWIKPMWVGPSEAVKGKNRYKVMLEL